MSLTLCCLSSGRSGTDSKYRHISPIYCATWGKNQIYWTLTQSWMQIAKTISLSYTLQRSLTSYRTHEVFTVFTSHSTGFQQRTFPFHWAPELSPASATSFSLLTTVTLNSTKKGQCYIMTDSQLTSLSRWQAPIWDSKRESYYSWTMWVCCSIHEVFMSLSVMAWYWLLTVDSLASALISHISQLLMAATVLPQWLTCWWVTLNSKQKK
jgi:hypothetical protein